MASPSSWYVTVIFFFFFLGCQVSELTARLSVFPLSDPSELLIRTLICWRDSGNCATSPGILTTIQALSQSALGIAADPHPPFSSPSLIIFKKPFDFSAVSPQPPKTKSTRLPVVQGSRLKLKRGRMRTTALRARWWRRWRKGVEWVGSGGNCWGWGGEGRRGDGGEK